MGWLGLSITVFEEGIESFLNSLQFFLLLLFEPLDGTRHIFGHFLLLDLLKSSQSLEILLLCHFPSEDISHYIFLIFLHSVQRLAELEDSDSSILISNSSVFSSNNLVSTSIVADFNAGKGSIWDFMRKGDLILSVVVIPNIHPSVFSSQEEGTNSGGWETTVTQVAWMISGFDQGCFEIVHPYFGTPIANRHEHLGKLKISGDAVDRTQMSMIESQSIVDFNRFL